MGGKPFVHVAVVLGTLLAMLATAVLLNFAADDTSSAHQTDPAFDDVRFACFDVRTAAASLDGDAAGRGKAVAVLDVAVELSGYAARINPSWTDLNASVSEFHAAVHSGEGTRISQGMADAVLACEGVPDPNLPGV